MKKRGRKSKGRATHSRGNAKTLRGKGKKSVPRRYFQGGGKF